MNESDDGVRKESFEDVGLGADPDVTASSIDRAGKTTIEP